MSPTPCPCGSGRDLAACCGRFHAGAAAPTAEALMRARYSAFVLGDAAYLLATWHPDTRPERVAMSAGPEWLGLEVRATTAGGADDLHGTVEFVARYRGGALHETSRFVRVQGHWLYRDGDIHPGAKPGRNDPCPCGSGRKFKRCCGTPRSL